MTDAAARPPAPACQRGARQRTTRQVAAIAALLLLLAGCTTSPTPPTSNGPVAGQSPAATQVDTPPPSPGPAPVPAYMPATADAPAQNVPTPVLPEKAREFSKEGLEAFARHWYSTLGYAYETGDLAPMTAITDPGCKTCAGAKTSITTIYGDGGWIVGAKVTIDSSTSNFAVVPDGTYQAIVWVQQEAGTTYLADGSSLAPKPASISRPDIVVAAFQQGQWKTMKAEHLTKE